MSSMTADHPILNDRFHRAVLQAGLIAFYEGRLDDSEYVKQLCYEFYEEDIRKKDAQK